MRGHGCAQTADILILDVAAILAQVGHDRISTCLLAQQGGAHRIGLAAAAGLAEGGDVVNVDAQARHDLFTQRR